MTDIVDGRLAFETKTTPQEIACECEQARRELSTEILHEHPDIVETTRRQSIFATGLPYLGRDITLPFGRIA